MLDLMPLIKDPAAIAAVNPKGEGVRILIVDDQAVVRGAVRSALERLDLRFVVIEASSARKRSLSSRRGRSIFSSAISCCRAYRGRICLRRRKAGKGAAPSWF